MEVSPAAVSRRPDALVVGGGIVGLACARELARRGLAVELFERRQPGAGASSAAAGLLAPFAHPPSDGPLIRAQLAARDAWPSWIEAVEEESGVAVERDDTGALWVSLDDAGDRHLEELAGAARRWEERVTEVPLATAQRWVPDLSPAVRRCLHLEGEVRIDNPAACRALTLAGRRAGVAVRAGAEIVAGRRSGGGIRVEGRAAGTPFVREAPLLVLAAGAWSGAVPGLPALPIVPVRGQMLSLDGVGWPWRGSVRGPVDYAVRRGEDGLLVGATVEDAGFAAHPTPEGLHRLLAFALELFPGLANRPVSRIWAGLRPGTPDDLPLVGWLPGWPVLVAAGHFRDGLLLAPTTAERIAELAVAGPASVAEQGAADPFSPARFFRPPPPAPPL